MIHLIQADYLLLILLVPIFFLVYGLMRRSRRKRIARFGDPELVARLMPEVSRHKGWVRLSLFSLAWIFFCLGLARPVMGARLREQEVKGVEVMVVLDVSNSMLAQDYSPNRLERAKLAISKLVDRLKDDRIGLIVFAGQSFVQLPITTDYVSAKIFLNTISTESVPVQGTALGDAIRTAVRSFSLESENSRAIVLITDGENHEDDPVAAARDAADMGIRIYCVGVGSPEGKPIPLPEGGLLTDREGEIVVTRLDEQVLRRVADAGGGLYVRAGNGEFGLNPVIDDIRNLESKRFQSVVFEDFEEQYMYFFAIALLLLLIEMSVGRRRNRRSLFGGTALRLMLPFVLLTALAGTASAQDDRAEVRKGNRRFKEKAYTEAEIEYKRGLLQDSLSAVARYNLGNALMLQDNPAEAERQYRLLGDSLASVSPLDPAAASRLRHNLGNALLAQRKYAEAVEAFKESLRKNPSDLDTKTNLAYAQRMLKDQQQQQNQDQSQNNDQNQDQDQNQNNDQNQDQNQNQDRNDDQNQNKDQDQNQDQNQDQDRNPRQSPGEAPKISPQAAQQMLQALADKEKETQEKVKKEKARLLQEKKKEKNW